ncbi:hypothetical protein BN1049_02303 [Pseudomonas saudimassiliensis]|uniref:Uncharacterized protein n=1 Tax=Pseudomonas saudimassiliensis TaxID=1461581 RepID=A0A078MM82_9PSED|nr:hypothetical protein [Pseudomonas saudimassiliensis]CEA05846.1 hypothetical protein BN1049_02303 [Pseudomonas saudimassiliensis]CEF27355.1 hypothetical protein BN1049_02303 [Pseudomonas saudimassiliensis]
MLRYRFSRHRHDGKMAPRRLSGMNMSSRIDAPPVTLFKSAQLKRKRIILDGKTYRAEMGAWAFYIPELELKLFHTSNGFLHCCHRTAPDRSALEHGHAVLHNETYSVEEWRAVYSKHVIRRTAENYVAASLLHRAGLGPRPLGVCLILTYKSPVSKAPCLNAGLFIENIHHYPPKHPATADDMLKAGVGPDKIKSCVRQQIKGYVSDLNSVVGVMPLSGQNDVLDIEQALFTRYQTYSAETISMDRPGIFRTLKRMVTS